MLDRIIRLIEVNKNIDGYKIVENKVESSELFFIKKSLDMDRAKNVHNFLVTVYKDFEEDGNKYKGSSTTHIHPTMNDEEIEKTLNDGVFAARFVKNPYYPLVKDKHVKGTTESSSFAGESLPYWMNEITKAIYKNDIHQKGGINSCEIFLNKVYTHIVNSEGIDAESENYEGVVEFITTWKEDKEEVELFRCIKFSEFEPEALAKEVEEMITICREKAVAKNTPLLQKCPVILTDEAVKKFFSFYHYKSSASAVYSKGSTWKVGDRVQGDNVKGDLVNMSLDPFMKNSTLSGSFDEDGFPLEAVSIIEEGVLKKYMANMRYAHYLDIEATGSINNIIVTGGSKTVEELKDGPYLEAAAFSDFSVDTMTGDFGGEIRLARYFDGKNIIPVTGGSISGNINELHGEIFLSREIQKENNFEGPKAIKLMNVTIAGVE